MQTIKQKSKHQHMLHIIATEYKNVYVMIHTLTSKLIK